MSDMPSAGSSVQLRGIELDEAAIRAHVMRPEHLAGTFSDRGPEGMAPVEAPAIRAGVVYEFDRDYFTLELAAALENSVAGYTLVMAHSDRNSGWSLTAPWQWAKEPQDGGELWLDDPRMHIASCSKIVTAIAMVKLLTRTGLSYDSKIINLLPRYWAKGPNVDQITFAELMTHRSGLNYELASSASDFEFMKAQIAAGTSHVGDYWYQNMNFGLCRILIPTIQGYLPVDWAPGNDAAWDRVTLDFYQDYVKKWVFEAGVSAAADESAPAYGGGAPTLTHAPEDALAYDFPVLGQGWNSGDLTTMAGGAGWHMSASYLLSLMGTFRRSGTIVTPAQAEAALRRGFGIDWPVDTPMGPFYVKNGLWGNRGGQVEQCVAFFLPANTELVLLVNSPVGPPPESKFLLRLVSELVRKSIRPR
jgi:CubicO group peptidase (beta-lactamase class C family)